MMDSHQSIQSRHFRAIEPGRDSLGGYIHGALAKGASSQDFSDDRWHWMKEEYSTWAKNEK